MNGENGKVVDPATQIEEWFDGTSQYKGFTKDQKRQGIVRVVDSYSIWLKQYKYDQLHGLGICWYDDGYIYVTMYKNGNRLGHIKWNSRDLTVLYSQNKSLFDSVLTEFLP